jgi:hypothetical protein
MLAHAGNLDGVRASSVGGDLEVALSDHRWQYFAELGGGRAHLGDDIGGLSGRAGIGVRWIARSARLEREGAIEMTLEAFTGVERYWWDTGAQRTRPDLGAGVGWQLRWFHHITLRSTARVVFAPSDRDLAVCRGECPARMSTTNAGLMAVIGVSR